LTDIQVLNFPVAFGKLANTSRDGVKLIKIANNVAVHMIFRFLTGFAGSAFLSVSGGAISDVFKNEFVAT
jgi:MFS family permease